MQVTAVSTEMKIKFMPFSNLKIKRVRDSVCVCMCVCAHACVHAHVCTNALYRVNETDVCLYQSVTVPVASRQWCQTTL